MNEKGIALVSENTELSEKLIMRLENLGVSKVAVKGCPVKLPNYIPKSLKEKMADLEIGFSQMNGKDDLMKKYKVLLRAHFIKRENEFRDKVEPVGEIPEGAAQ